ncbi:AraC family transcriptional regulator [Bradyrhizobium sp. BRP22]|uniref:helix-turn-helix domain-containing protein n=1 Tax=Bradyrhizobium sp. BRP22 TaxID=2793821 RepID=UPI001CD5E680|nr:AraC family transcriptional regulator [Bradyrhizobium sp. BRP22]MCA1454614.1 AraC family transcriptional regulator [Bradyrhizobium sp. BRP22]
MPQPISKIDATNIVICLYRPINVDECFPALADFVEEIVDWDFPDAEVARAVAIKVLPGTRPCFIVQYRDSMKSSRKFGDTDRRHRNYRNIITKVDSGISTIRASGPLGAIIVRFRPEAAAHFLAERLDHFADCKIELDDVFDAHEISLLEERVSEAPSSADRAAAVAQFLCAHARPREPDPVICQAAARLRRNPSLRVRRLAANLDVSERHLLRKFHTIFGTSPKQFARCARLEKVLAARRNGLGWADIAYGCGFADQAHMISDFHAVLGAPPERALLPPSAERCCITDETNAGPISYDYFMW